MQLGYDWLLKTPSSSMMPAMRSNARTIASYVAYFRQLVGATLEFDDTIIGGQGIVVEIDESKFGKRKYNRGHSVEGMWVLGGVERTAAKKTFLQVVPDRSAETLLSVIADHVAEGSIIMTDLWRGYSGLTDLLGFPHLTVNHNLEFVNKETGCCTNTIEGIWNGVKLSIAPRQRTAKIAPGCLLEYIWRIKHKTDIWGAFIQALRNVGYPSG
jgi:hypothetical protein